MSKSKSTKKAAAKTRKGAKTEMAPEIQSAEALADQAIALAKTAIKPKGDGLCTFAFRLTSEERNAIHKAAGPGKASKFARTLLVAAARNDEAAVSAIMSAIETEA